MGMAVSGFGNAGVLEWNPEACQTIRANKDGGHHLVRDWEVYQEDARTFPFGAFAERAQIVTGGPPCQPFSMGGCHRAFLDSRDMFPQAVRAVREVRPQAFIFENVRGLTRQTFRNYFNYILLQLEFPDHIARPAETWEAHLARLEQIKTRGGRSSGLRYKVVNRVLNAADYGVPQKREHVFIVGIREDVKAKWSFPDPTHTEDALLYDQFVSGSYWDEHRVSKRLRPTLKGRLLGRVKAISCESRSLLGKRWATVRDALAGLPDPQLFYSRFVCLIGTSQVRQLAESLVLAALLCPALHFGGLTAMLALLGGGMLLITGTQLPRLVRQAIREDKPNLA